MWKVEFQIQVHANCSTCSSEDVRLTNSVEIPFVPFNGLVVVDGDNSFKVDELHWDVYDEKFLVYTEDKTFYNHRSPAPTKQEMWDHVQEFYLSEGWQIKSGGMLWPRCPDHGFGMSPQPPTGALWTCGEGKDGPGHSLPHWKLDFGYDGGPAWVAP